MQGIVGHTKGKVKVFANLEELEKMLPELLQQESIYVVAQTTFRVESWEKCKEFLKKQCTKAEIFDTICNATWARQQLSLIHIFFPVWLALLHVLHLPYLVSGAALWCAASLLAAFAFAPLWRNAEPGCGRVLTLGLFGALSFLPSGWAAYTLRVYRDNIFPALCLVFFAGMAGMALRAVFYTAKQKPLWPWLLAAGVGLALSLIHI